MLINTSEAFQVRREGPIPARIFEMFLIFAMIITAFAMYFREPLTAVRLIITPKGNGVLYHSYRFGDEGNGGSSKATEALGEPLHWSCSLTNKYKYGFCGFGMLFDLQNTGRGVDLGDFDRVKVNLKYEGPGKSLRLGLKNKDPRYLALGAPSDEKVSQTSVSLSRGQQVIELEFDWFAVAEWWRDSAAKQGFELAQPEFSNIVSLELLTGVEAAVGTHRIQLRNVTLEGSAISTESWYGGISLAWLLIVGGLLFQRRRQAAQWQKELTDSLQTTINTIPHLVWTMSEEGKLHFNKRWQEFTGSAIDGEVGNRWLDLMHPDEVAAVVEAWEERARSKEPFEIECRLKHVSGVYRWVRTLAVPAIAADGSVNGWYGTCTDIHDRVKAQRELLDSIAGERRKSQQLKWASEHDGLTGLPNRRAFQSRLEDETARVRLSGGEMGLLLIDLDHFKHVNDSLGHFAGDNLLKAMGERLRASVRREDFVARLGGDEFAVLLGGACLEKDLVGACESVLAAINAPMKIEEHVIRPGASIGAAIFPTDAVNADDFFKAADAALYALKRSGRGGYKLFQRYMLDQVERAAVQLATARQVVAENSIVAFYQPKVTVRTGEVVGFEALLRYKTPGGELGVPDNIEEAFKDYELAAKIGELMHRKVARDIRGWLATGFNFARVSINAAPAEFLRDDYAERLLKVLAQNGVPADRVEVEITEHALLDRGPQYVARALSTLKGAGITISLDDFGTGYSSLAHLRDFPVDLIKIDQSFVRNIVEDEEAAALTAGVVHLATSLGLDVVAEGVETVEQLQMLRSIGCQFAQGHLFGSAAEPASFVRSGVASGPPASTRKLALG